MYTADVEQPAQLHLCLFSRDKFSLASSTTRERYFLNVVMNTFLVFTASWTECDISLRKLRFVPFFFLQEV